MNTHTEGPWIVEQVEVDNYIDGEFQVWTDYSGGVSAEIAGRIMEPANAKLIAAAPDLLEALRAMTTEPTDNPDHWLRAMNDAQRAINKATI